MRRLALIPLALCYACTVAPRPPAQAYAPAATIPALATQPPADAVGTLNAAQVQATEAAQQTQAVSNATQSSRLETQVASTSLAVETQKRRDEVAFNISVSQTLQAVDATQNSYNSSWELTQVKIAIVKSEATLTQQALTSQAVREIDSANQARASAGAWTNFWLFVGIGGAVTIYWSIAQFVKRRRDAPYIGRDGQVIVQQAQPAQLPAPRLTQASRVGLMFISDCISVNGGASNQVPAWEILKSAGSRFGSSGQRWQEAKNLFGGLLYSSHKGTFCADGITLQSLYEDIRDGRRVLVDQPPHRPTDDILAHSPLSGVFEEVEYSEGG